MKKKLSSLVVLFFVAQFFVPNFSFATMNDAEDLTCETAPDYIIPILEAEAEENGVKLEWEEVDHPQFEGYKIVISKDNPEPTYSEDGYLVFLTNPSVHSYLVYNAQKYNNGDFGDYLEPGQEYYFSITVLYSCGEQVSSNAVRVVFPDISSSDDTSDEENNDATEDDSSVLEDSTSDVEAIVGELTSVKDQFKKHKKELKKNKKYLREKIKKEKKERDNELDDIKKKARLLKDNNLEDILSELKELRSIVKEQQTQIKYLKSLSGDLKKIATNMRNAIENFVTYGVDNNTKGLGEGERAAVIHSYKKAFGKLPSNDAELEDAIKIANGRWPSLRNKVAEERAGKIFEDIYNRAPNLDNPRDNAAVTIMAYGLRQRAENRKLESEQNGLKIYQDIFGRLPETTEDWNVMQAITYSGATR